MFVLTILCIYTDMTSTPINISTEQCFTECQSACLYVILLFHMSHYHLQYQLLYYLSAVLSIIGTTLITSLVWCCAENKMRKKRDADIDPHTVSTQQESMLTPFQGNISLQENVAYGQVGSRIRK